MEAAAKERANGGWAGDAPLRREAAAKEKKTERRCDDDDEGEWGFLPLSSPVGPSLLLSVPCPFHSFCFGFGLAAPFFPFFSSSRLPGLLMVTREADVVHYIKRKEVLDADC